MSTMISPVGVTVLATVGTSSASIAAPNPSRLGIYLFNPNVSTVIWVCPQNGPQTPLNPGGVNLPAAVNGAGSIPLQPQQGLMLGPPNNMPPFTNGLNAICATPGTPVTIWEFYP